MGYPAYVVRIHSLGGGASLAAAALGYAEGKVAAGDHRESGLPAHSRGAVSPWEASAPRCMGRSLEASRLEIPTDVELLLSD